MKDLPIAFKIHIMKYTLKLQTSWHDTDAFRRVRPSKVLEYMQETANRQCEATGLPLDRLRDEKGLAFILGALSMNIHKPIYAYESIEIKTWCREAKSYIFNRYFEIYRGEEKLAEASSTWVLLDIESKNMVKACNYPFLKDCFYYDEPIDPESLPQKAKIGNDTALEELGERRIVYSDIDYNMHMNNTRYPDMLCDFLCEAEEGRQISSISLSYLKESHLGDVLKLKRRTDENGRVLVKTENQRGEACLDAILTFQQ